MEKATPMAPIVLEPFADESSVTYYILTEILIHQKDTKRGENNSDVQLATIIPQH